MMSLTTYAFVLVPCLVSGAAALGIVTLRRSAARLDRRIARLAAEATASPPRDPLADRSWPARRAVGR
ncbi:hypothetical protein OPKNFCMD_3729 [Methylobacterium crusticola]|uniref:Heme exporter protein D n=1 Tax=Methylobacterium crusticola TaxID=1697972 RepID=A0ABQ4QZX9_9HYPH|nr:hypothetical protein [Methylobacterium crusticola]GJD50978.1 hypothetical protein OPKNFCMD_3729 [Methylobacterium crusticola]